jgi:hypothetical protein
MDGWSKMGGNVKKYRQMRKKGRKKAIHKTLYRNQLFSGGTYVKID